MAASNEVKDQTVSIRAVKPIALQSLIQVYGDAVLKSRTVGRPVSFRVEVGPEGDALVTPVDEAGAQAEPSLETPSIALQAALIKARERGRLRAAEILSGDDMLSADAFARRLGTTRVTVNKKRQNGQVLGLDGAKRGFRFPIWQLDSQGMPFAELTELHARLGSPWAVYRFLVQPHAELGGLTGCQALERGKNHAVLQAAESAGRDFG